MLNLETARVLRYAGYVPSPQNGDTVYCDNQTGIWIDGEVKNGDSVITGWGVILVLPRLDQLLAEGDNLGYVIEIDTICFGEDLHPSHQATVKKWSEEELELCYTSFYFDDRAEAAAQALLWILQEGK